MVEKNKFSKLQEEPKAPKQETRSRLSSNVGSDLGEIDLSDLEHCILC
jgi:hypothetical protein